MEFQTYIVTVQLQSCRVILVRIGVVRRRFVGVLYEVKHVFCVDCVVCDLVSSIKPLDEFYVIHTVNILIINTSTYALNKMQPDTIYNSYMFRHRCTLIRELFRIKEYKANS